MTRILLAERSPHAQRMGERILREEGYSVTTVTDGETAMLRLKDARPNLVIADVGLGGFNGYQLCEFVKSSSDLAGTPVVLTVGALELPDDERIKSVRADGFVRKPFEATALLDLAGRLSGGPSTERGVVDRTQAGETATRSLRSVVVLDPERVRAAVTIALDDAMEPLIQRVTERVLEVLAAKS